MRTRQLKIIKIYHEKMNDNNLPAAEITREQAINWIEVHGYYLQGTVDKILQSGIKQKLQTCWATYSFC